MCDHCEKSIENKFQKFLTQNDAVENYELRTFLFAEIDRHLPEIAPMVKQFELRVMTSRKFLSAWAVPVQCTKCSSQRLLIGVSSNLLFLIWRLQMINLSLIIEWTENGRTRIVFRDPNEEDLAQIRQAVDLYLEGKGEPLTGIRSLLTAFSRSPPRARSSLLKLVSLGEIWVVLHELAHLVRGLVPEHIRRSARSYINSIKGTMQLMPKYQRLWCREIEADLFAADLMTIGLANSAGRSGASAEQARLAAGWFATGGIASGCDALGYIERLPNVNFKPMSETTHPPVFCRINAMSQYIAQRVRSPNHAETGQLAGVVAQISYTLYSKLEASV